MSPRHSSHPAFSYRPETGEEIYHSLLAVPISRSGQVLGVLVIQNRTPREYSDEDVEVLQATAMVIVENLVSGSVAGTVAAIEASRSQPTVIEGEPLSDGIALGHVVLHEPRIVVTQLMAENPAIELERLDLALDKLQKNIDEMFEHEHLSNAGEHRDHLVEHREPVEVGQHHVEDHQVRPERVDRRQRVRGRYHGDLDLGTPHAERHRDQVGDARLVVDDQDPSAQEGH